MAKTETTGVPSTENGRGAAVTKRDDYRAPKLTVVGTVEDLTRGTGNSGAVDGLYFTSGGG